MAGGAPIRIRIGASVDSSVSKTFESIEKRAQKAQVAVQKGQKQAADNAAKEAAREAAAKAKAAKAIEQAAARAARAQEREAQKLTAAAIALDRQRSQALFQQHRLRERAEAQSQAKLQREIEKTARKTEQALARERRAHERTARRQGESFARRTSHRATRFLMPEAPIGSMAMRGLGDVARGAGVDFSIAGAVSRATDLEAHATKVSNAGFLPNDVGSPNAKRVDPKALVAQSREVAGQFGLDAGTALDALDAFATRAGDLDTGRRMLADMARLSAATGTELGHMAQASAAVFQALGDVPNKSQAVMEVMKTIAGQGKLGAVEIADMAVQMSRVAAASMQFSGDRSENIKTMGGLVQFARAKGGAPSAAEAARSVGGFANTLKKSARIKEFEAHGVNVFSDESKTKFRDPLEIITDSLKATGGNLQEMNKLFMDVVGARTVSGLSEEFLRAGGGDKGADAVRKIMDRMKAAAPSEQELQESSARAASTTAAKAARFQNQLDEIAERVMVDLIPALEKAGPSLLKFAEVVGNISTWAVQNPKSAIAAAITASIARAGIESTLRSGIERIMLGKDNSKAASLGKIASTAGAALSIATLAVTTVTVGQMVIDSFMDERDKEHRKVVGSEGQVASLTGEVEAKLASGDIKGAEAAAAKRVEEGEKAVKLREERSTGDFEKAFQNFLVGIGVADGKDFRANEKRNAEALAENKRELEMSRQHLAAIRESLEQMAAMGPGGGPIPGRAEQ